MTHEELLAKIDEHEEFAGINGGNSSSFQALRAVVELHRQMDDNSCYHCATWYPCATIQAIEKDLR